MSLSLQNDVLLTNIQKIIYGAYLDYDTKCYNRLMYISLDGILKLYEKYYYNQKTTQWLEEMMKMRLKTIFKEKLKYFGKERDNSVTLF